MAPMDPVQEPRRLTKADVPRLRNRIWAISGKNSQHRSGGEIATFVVAFVLLMTVNAVIQASGASVIVKVAEVVLAVAIVVTTATALLLRIRFPR
jgi:hypothetical protein